MSTLDSVHLISQITHDSKPRISEIVKLFNGFIYSSRFTEEDCVALYHNRVISKLHSDKQFELEKSSVSIALSSTNIEVVWCQT